ncbi:hypothetical protein TVAG_056400 [Trichomonas vaginalis G3]|uniref:HECT domain-containing protein n=1 Tax=Trichomonas vaginalis (strain ATCC PRA-98 / G3) TaxID=412133 RepID=A2ECJ9_TRIV3|nr:E3 ubiquitin-protein ligase trip12 family [Trichomonas vaginalis G3]EAY09596.1 hypothetical protein TVAG_056400 [Trichomonas vaginalis G3]KAI5502108.1 E3 ubiquitin-protein ligase trip12 family [Trichomonas vaginalis G3]|eukprot:XP_001321819.1 hypothetical protein [Trichomonas vaginalis G3]
MRRVIQANQMDPEWLAIIEQLKTERPIPALKLIADKIQFTEQQIAYRLPFDEICARIDDILSQLNRVDILELATECVFKIADSLDNTYDLYSKTKIFQHLRNFIDRKLSSKITENCLRTFITISKVNPEELCKTVGIDPLIKAINECSLIDQKDAFVAMARMTEKYVDNNMISNLQDIAPFFTEYNLRLVIHAVKTFHNIVSRLNISTAPPKVINQIAVSLLVITDMNSDILLLEDLIKLVQIHSLLHAFVISPIDFNGIISQAQSTSREVELYTKIVSLINVTLKHYSKVKASKSTNIILSFINKAFPVIIDVLQNHRGSAKTSLECIKYILKLNPSADISCLYESFTGYAIDNELVKSILDIANNVPNQMSLAKSPIPSILIGAKKRLSNDKDFVKRVDLILSKLDSSGFATLKEINSITSFEQLYDLLITQNMPLYDFVNTGGLEAAKEFLYTYQGRIDVVGEESLKQLVEASHSILSGFPVPHDEDILGSERNDKFESFSINVDIEMPNMGTENFRLEITIDFSAIEAFYNQRRRGVTFDIMKRSFDRNPIISRHLKRIDEKIQYSKLAVLNRIANTPEYKRCSFKIGNSIFSARDNVFQSICKVIKDPKLLKEKCPLIKIIEGDSNPAPFDLYQVSKVPQQILPTFELLSIIHRLHPTLNLVCQAFSDHIAPSLASIANTVGGFSSAGSMMYNYPYLFDLKHRILFFKELAFDLPAGFYSMYIEFIKPEARRSEKAIKYNCQLNRDNLAAEGATVLNAFAPSMGILEVQFIGDEGMGYGPTQEFFTLFSHELCRTSRGLWRTNDPQAEFAFSQTGLYPSPAASNEDLRLLGMFCAKALQTQFIVDLPLSPHFIRTLRNEDVTVQDVDPQLAIALENPEGLIGLDFTYPGLYDFPICPNGQMIEINQENVNDYVSKIRDFTCGKVMKTKCHSFIEGFNQVLHWEPTCVFTPEELIQIITGSFQRITIQDLMNNVEVGTGYKKDSPVITNFFEVIEEMNDEDQKLLIRFITGSVNLPIGGLAGLQPKLTVAERAPDKGANYDDCLPSVMTCFNYFKLPMYSSKEILRERLMTAVRGCQGSFGLS